MSSTTLRRRLGLTFLALSLVTLVGVVVTLVVCFRLYETQTKVVDRLFGTVTAAADLEQALLEQDTAFHRYVLTGDGRFRDRYEQAASSVETARRPLQRAEQDFPTLREQRLRVERSVEQWQVGTVRPLITSMSPIAASEADLSVSDQRFAEVRSALADYRSEVLRLRGEEVAELRLEMILLFVVLGLGLVLLLASAAAAWLALRNWVTRPLERLGREVDRVESGDLQHEVTMSEAPQEIHALAGQVDRMRVRILHEYALTEQSRTEALEARAVVEQQAADLQRSNAELEQFAYVASHDLQEPLRKVASFCQLLERRYKGQLDERGEQYIEFAVDGAKRMQQLINDLLAFSRVGRTSSDFTPVDLEVVLDQALRQLAARLEESGGVVTHDPLPAVLGEPGLLVQLFQNLVGNGLKFRSDDPPRVHVGVRRAGDEDVWEFSCADNGIGIEPQYDEKIFVIFQRLHGRDVYGGTGIGLAMCRKIVEHHGGRLWLDTSGEGRGATFRWTMPAMIEDSTNTDAGAGPGLATTAREGVR